MSDLRKVASMAFSNARRYAYLYKMAAEQEDVRPSVEVNLHESGVDENVDISPYGRALKEQAGLHPDATRHGHPFLMPRMTYFGDEHPLQPRYRQINDFFRKNPDLRELPPAQKEAATAFLLNSGDENYRAWDPKTGKFPEGHNPIKRGFQRLNKGLQGVFDTIPTHLQYILKRQSPLMGSRGARPGRGRTAIG